MNTTAKPVNENDSKQKTCLLVTVHTYNTRSSCCGILRDTINSETTAVLEGQRYDNFSPVVLSVTAFSQPPTQVPGSRLMRVTRAWSLVSTFFVDAKRQQKPTATSLRCSFSFYFIRLVQRFFIAIIYCHHSTFSFALHFFFACSQQFSLFIFFFFPVVHSFICSCIHSFNRFFVSFVFSGS